MAMHVLKDTVFLLLLQPEDLHVVVNFMKMKVKQNQWQPYVDTLFQILRNNPAYAPIGNYSCMCPYIYVPICVFVFVRTCTYAYFASVRKCLLVHISIFSFAFAS